MVIYTTQPVLWSYKKFQGIILTLKVKVPFPLLYNGISSNFFLSCELEKSGRLLTLQMFHVYMDNLACS